MMIFGPNAKDTQEIQPYLVKGKKKRGKRRRKGGKGERRREKRVERRIGKRGKEK